jgi:hypothetical protein
MSSPARVSDIQALSTFRPSLIRFSEDVRTALTSPVSDAGKVISWMQRERLPYWKREIRLRSEAAVRANTELVERSSSHDPRSSVDARKAYELAKRRVRVAEEKHEITRMSILKLEKALEKYRGAVQPMASVARADMHAAVVKLDGYIAALHAYTSAGQSSDSKQAPAQTEAQTKAQSELEDGDTQ